MISTVLFHREATEFVNELIEQKSKVFVLVDEHTHRHCWPIFAKSLRQASVCEVLEIKSGEQNKQLAVFQSLLSTMVELGADRHSLLINLGGGVITDMGGYVASSFMRGIAYVNIPTTLLAMVDAAHGGKVGVDLEQYKNLIGAMYPSEAVLVYPEFLETLPKIEYQSGYAEALKHGLIAKESLWQKLSSQVLNAVEIGALLPEIIDVKANIVKKDPLEKNWRKTLNYGHSIGHAIESVALAQKDPLPHGFAIALGMRAENIMAQKQGLLDENTCVKVNHLIRSIYGHQPEKVEHVEAILETLSKDKKNQNGQLFYAPIEGLGKGLWNKPYTKYLAKEVLTALN